MVTKLTHMEKTQVYLRKEELAALRQAAARSGRSILSWSAMQSAKSCSSRTPRVQLPSGMASHGDRLSNTIVSTMSRDAAGRRGFRRQRGVDRSCAVTRPTPYARAREQWELLQRVGAKLHTSAAAIIETFTFLDRNANRDVALMSLCCSWI